MDISNSSSINSSDLDTMGNILAQSNENTSQVSEPDQSTDTIQEESALTSENIEVTEHRNENIPVTSSDDVKGELESFTTNLTTQDIDLIIMGKPSDDVEPDPIPESSGMAVSLNISESDDNVEDLWLEGNTRELVKVDHDEDFEVIVKSLETAIVETERYDIELDISADKEPVLSPTLLSASIVEPACETDPVLSSDSLLNDLSKELIPSPLITPSLSEMAEHGEQVMLSDDIEITDDITKELEVEAAKLQTEDTDTQDQCLESLIDTSIITNEFSAITGDIQETFDEQTSSLFDTADSVTDMAESIQNEPSLLELQEADMVCDISEEINRDMDKDFLPLINDTVFESSVDSTEDMLNNIVSTSLENELIPELIESQRNEEIDKEVDDELLDFSETDSSDIKDENSTVEIIDNLVDTTIDLEEKPVEEIDENLIEEPEVKSVEDSEEKFMQELEDKSAKEIEEELTHEIDENPDEEIEEKTDEKCQDVLLTEDEEQNPVDIEDQTTTSTILTKDEEIMVQTENRSDIDTPDNTIPEITLENIAEINISNKNEISDSSIKSDIKITCDRVVDNVANIDEPESVQEEVILSTSADLAQESNESSSDESIIEPEVKRDVKELGTIPTEDTNIENVAMSDETELISEIKEIVKETSTIVSSKNTCELETVSENLIEEASEEKGKVLNEQIIESSVIPEEILVKSPIQAEKTILESTDFVLKEVIVEKSVTVEENIAKSPVTVEENIAKSPVTVEENIANSPIIPEENILKLPVIPEENVVKLPVVVEENLTKSSVTLAENVTQSPVTLEENITKSQVILQESITKSPVILEEIIANSPVILEESIANVAVSLPESTVPVVADPIIDESSNTAKIDSPDMSSVVEVHVAKSPILPEEPKSSVITDYLAIEKEENKDNLTSSSSHETQTPIVEDEVKQRKHSLYVDETEQSPPKKIKLVREKLYPPPAKIYDLTLSSTLEDKTSKDVEQKSEDLPESKSFETEKMEVSIQEPAQEQSENVICVAGEIREHKIIVEEKTTSPVKTQRLKLKRNYKPPEIVSKPTANVIQSQEIVNKPEESVTRDKEEMQEKTVDISTNISEQESVQVKPVVLTEDVSTEQESVQVKTVVLSEDVSTDDSTDFKTTLTESEKEAETIPVIAESVTKYEDSKLVISDEPALGTHMETEQSANTEERSIHEQLVVTEKNNLLELDGEIELNKDTKSESANITEVDIKTEDTVSIDKSVEELVLAEQPNKDTEINISTANKNIDDDGKTENMEQHVIESEMEDNENIIIASTTKDVVEKSTVLDSDVRTTTKLVSIDEEIISVKEPKETSSEELIEIYSSVSKESTVTVQEYLTSANVESTMLAVPEETSLGNLEMPSSPGTKDTSIVSLEEMSLPVSDKPSLAGSEDTTLVTAEINTLPDSEETKSITMDEHLLIKGNDIVLAREEGKVISMTIEEQIDTNDDDKEEHKMEAITIEPQPLIKEDESVIDREEDEIMQAAKEVERRDELSETTSEENEDEIMKAALEVVTRSEQFEIVIEENEDAIMQAAKEVEIRIEQPQAAMEDDVPEEQSEFSEKSMTISEDEIIAVTQALEMERAESKKAEELDKSESEADTIMTALDKQESVTVLPYSTGSENFPSIERVPDTELSILKKTLISPVKIVEHLKVALQQKEPVENVEVKKPSSHVIDQKPESLKVIESKEQADESVTLFANKPSKAEGNILKRLISERIKTTAVKKIKKSPMPVLDDTCEIKVRKITPADLKVKNIIQKSMSSQKSDASTSQTVTIEPVTAQSPVETVGKSKRRKPEMLVPILSKSTTITRPLRVEVEDLGNSPLSPYYSDASRQKETENIPKIVIKPIPKPEERSSPKITIKPIVKPPDMVLSPKTQKSKSSDDSCTPRITIKPIIKTDPLKITITKQKTDDTHSILKIYKPDDSQLQLDDHHVPKLTIKPIPKCDEMQHSPRITIKPVKPPSQHSPSTCVSPKITVKPVIAPSDHHVEITHSPKITIKPILRPDDSQRAQLSPRQIKLKSMTFESSSGVTVEPISVHMHSPSLQNMESQMVPLKISVKQFAKMEDTLSPKLTIKPITKTCEIVQSEDGSSNPLKLTIKPILKPEESYQSPKITIKPIMKPEEMDQGVEEADKPGRIILKIQKTSLPSPKDRSSSHSKESKKEPEVKIEAIPQDFDRNQKLNKIKLKLTKEGSHAQIISSVPSMMSEQFSLKRPLLFSDAGVSDKRSKSEFSGTEILHTSDISINLVEPNAKPNPKTISEEVTIVKLDRSSTSGATPLAEHISQSKFKEMLLKIQQKADITCTRHIEQDGNSSSSDDVKIVGVGVISNDPLKDPLSIHDESNSQDVMIVNEVINTNPFHGVQIINARSLSDPSVQQTPKKRGRPRKNPLEVKPEIKGEDCVEVVRPKRTCRAPPGRTPFAVKERKPRGAGRARGGGRGRGGARSPPKSPKEPKTPRGKALKEAKALAKLEAAKLAQEVVIDEITIEDSTNDTPSATPVPPIEDTPKKLTEVIEPDVQMVDTEVQIMQITEELLKEPQPPPVAVYEDETRMSADNNSSRAQTPARQVVNPPQLEGPEESQSSVQSSATTESNKNKKGRLEVCDPDSAVTGVEQIVEYSWGGGGTYMLQEQIAQFLGVKSFKRKYPGLTRRPVEMQERDYIREKGLVSESMCDMGLTAVPSSEILDIMYTDFQEKYEEYRKCMRDKQSKEISNKQKAISLATSQEKNKIDFKERAIRSAANWNVNFNKARKESRRCCMDLQTFTINFPVGRTQSKVPHKNPVGHYPIALVPGQFTDYYKPYTSNELHYSPLNTVRYGPVMPNQHCDDGGQSDGSQSDTDSSSGSDSDSSDDSMSTVEDAPPTTFGKPAGINLTPLSTPKAKVH